MNNWRALGWCLATSLGIVALAAPQDAEACGCFAPPNPATPVVQAGEQIVFAMKDGRVTMHVRVQYSGPAEEFGWLLPLPSVPEVGLGTEELFVALEQATRPTFRLSWETVGDCAVAVDAGSFGGADAGAPSNGSDDAPPGGVLVRREAVGPYDTAVLRADDQAEMLAWLQDNGFFVPDPLGAAVAPYIRPGSYFLALKLLSDRDAGDITPLVLDYAAELPMIPMVLTQVGAEDDMPVTAYVLGAHRAIPRNYRHTVLDLAHIDWFGAGSNYVDVVSAAVDEADGHHSFVTEFAGASTRMVDVLDGPSRFGDRASLEATTDAAAYVSQLRFRQFLWTTTLVAILQARFPMPEAVRGQFSEDVYYANLDWFLGPYRDQNPEQFEGTSFEFDPVELTAVLWTTIVEPTRAAGQLFRDHGNLTRLFTTLSPEEMTKDPVFSFNPDLPDVDNAHVATFTRTCEPGMFPPSGGVLELPDGRTYETSPRDWRTTVSNLDAPFSARIEILREEGQPQVEVDNTGGANPGGSVGGGPGAGPGDASNSARGSSCQAVGGGELAGLLALGLLAGLLRRRRR